MNIDLFNYDLPEELIAQTPLTDRTASRFLIYHQKSHKIEHKYFKDLINYLKKGDTIVLNDTKVIPARLYALKKETSALIEVLLLKDLGNDIWQCLTKPAKRLKEGTELEVQDKLKLKVIKKLDDGICHIKLIYHGILVNILDELGEMPLPPYIHEKLKDKNMYQTVYAKNLGSAAAPTAGFHFDQEQIKELEKKGINFAYLTLHVGLGTFRPVKEGHIEDHEMHSEYYELDQKNADLINETINNNHKLIVVGTTCVRTLETIATKKGQIAASSGWTNIYIYPGYKYKVVKNLITNFHLPKSTLIMLVAALIGRKEVLNIYKIAVQEKYRFFSFGDSMMVLDD